MLKRFVVLAVLMILAARVSFAQENFEGVVEVKITNSRGETNDLKFYTRGDAFKLESEDDVKHGNILVKKDSIYILMPEQKKYIQMPVNVNNKVAKYSSKADNLKRTGETKKILDYEAEKWLFEDNGSSVEIWNTSELGNLVNVSYFIPEAADEDWYKDLFDKGFFPLSVIVTNTSQKVVNKMEVTDVEKKELEEEDFALPEDFDMMQTSKK